MMKKYLALFFVFFTTIKVPAQTINQYLNGIWKMECCSIYYNIWINNKIYTIDVKFSKNDDINAFVSYCIPKIPTYTENDSLGKVFKEMVSIDSVDFDRTLKLNDTGIEQVYLLEYKNDDVINKQIKITDIAPSLSYYYINPKETKRYYTWDGTAPSKIVYYNRIISPPKYVLDFYKKVAPQRFKKIKVLKSFIYDDKISKTKIYLIKNDEVEILEEKQEWLKIRYYGNGATIGKTLEGWIKKSDVE